MFGRFSVDVVAKAMVSTMDNIDVSDIYTLNHTGSKHKTYTEKNCTTTTKMPTPLRMTSKPTLLTTTSLASDWFASLLPHPPSSLLPPNCRDPTPPA